ncbi:MAG: hypothetical protein A3G21_15845 [Acidobacteria bacterium RIFCSPLOWO2_12_FULL_66_21]|nr:MAG: hypothetical protein A3G21_15845 [Acidobacteria bacterium RIFCSPLOWO2_12_FULL_66_21]
MSTQHNAQAPLRKPLRLWPGVVLAALLVLIRFVIPAFVPDTLVFGIMGAIVTSLGIIAWWMFFSRTPWAERAGALVVVAVALAATRRVVHPSIAGGMMGMMVFIYGIPLLSLAFVASVVASRRLSNGLRRASMVAAILVGCGVLTLVRTDGVTGNSGSVFHWRWTPTSEQRLLAQAPALDTPAEVPAPKSADAAATALTPPSKATKPPGIPAAIEPGLERVEWPGFRGGDRDGVVRGVRIETDWSTSPPVQLWRRPIGPGWSSFAVSGDLLYTQEQRGEDEIVACYRLTTGAPVWRHRDRTRFYESNGGPGPRGTPSLSGGRLYTFGATGILNALDARDGAVVWSRNVASDVNTEVPTWGFSSSPLVIDDVVIVAASGTLVGYDVATGNSRWVGPSQLGSYSSPHRATIDGVTQVLLLNGSGAAAVAPSTGALLWSYPWTGGGTTIVQPALTSDGNILINTLGMAGGAGIRRIALAQGSGGWTVKERWTSTGLKPYFNDFVVHNGHAFGFDGNILSCIDLADGKRKWKGGRYGNGQLVLLSDQDLLLVLSEEGELALVRATPDQLTEIARIPAIQGKTWNHPALTGDVLLVRNGEEMAAFRLSLARR